MSSYATPAQLAVYLGRPGGEFDDDAETARAQQLLDDATGTIVDELGQDLAEVETTSVLDGTGTARLILPRHPVTAVTSVAVTDVDGAATVLTEDTDYTWSASGVLTRRGAVWPCHDRAVTVMYTAGYADIPAAAQRICRRLAAAAWPNPAGAETQDIGDSRYRWFVPGGELTTGEMRQLDPYRCR